MEPLKRADGATYYRARIRHLDCFSGARGHAGEARDAGRRADRPPTRGAVGPRLLEDADETHELDERRKARLG